MFIETDTYRTILNNVTNICVDVCLRYDNKFLLIKRTEEPCKGVYWPIGGRIHKGEKAENAARRKILEEIGIDFTQELKPLGYYEDTYSVMSLGEMDYSTISICWLGYLNKEQVSEIKLDDTSEGYAFNLTLPERFKINTFEDFGRPYWYLKSVGQI